VIAPNRIRGRAATSALLAIASLGFCAAGLGSLLQGALVPVEARMAQKQLQRDFARELVANRPPLPNPPNDQAAPIIATARLPLAESRTTPKTAAPGKPVARLTVKRLDVDDIVLAGPESHDELARGPTILKRGDPASPVTILAAHRDTHFLFIRDLREGDVVTMQYVTGESQRYRVTYLETVRWDTFAYPLDPPRPLLALTTCYPFGGTEYGGPWRRVAWAERIG
jgi:sortase A